MFFLIAMKQFSGGAYIQICIVYKHIFELRVPQNGYFHNNIKLDYFTITYFLFTTCEKVKPNYFQTFHWNYTQNHLPVTPVCGKAIFSLLKQTLFCMEGNRIAQARDIMDAAIKRAAVQGTNLKTYSLLNPHVLGTTTYLYLYSIISI